MNEATGSVPMKLMTPPLDQVEQRIKQTRNLFHRTLSCWASDVLVLRKARLHQFTWREQMTTWPTSGQAA